jgi:large subunit ribosomal protein L30
MKIAVIRLKGKFSLSPNIKTTLESLRLTRLNTATILTMNDSLKGMLQACKDVVSYGEVDEETVAFVLSKRGMSPDGKSLSSGKKLGEIAKIAKDFFASDKKLEEFGASGVLFLKPPRGGFGGRKIQTPFGIAGKNPNISELLRKMA